MEGERAQLPKPGDLLGGKYTIVRVIGEGGAGLVFEARHERLNTRVAIKLLHSSARSEEHIARLEREARAIVQLRSENVARVFDVDTLPDGSPFMVMEYLEGRDLGKEIASRGQLPFRDAVGHILDACAAMREAHALGIVHRDLSTGNLFLTTTPQGQLIKVLDFGISKVAADRKVAVTTTRSILGTPLYMSPEQVRSPRDVDARTDIWSLGVILYEMLAGVPPFDGETATAIVAGIIADAPKPLDAYRADLPNDLKRAVMAALAKDRADRFQTIEAFAAALEPFGPATVASAAVTPRTKSGRAVMDESTSEVISMTTSSGPAPRPRTFVVAGAGALLLAGIAAAFALSRGAATHFAPDAVAPALSAVQAATDVAPAEPAATAAPVDLPSPPPTNSVEDPSAAKSALPPLKARPRSSIATKASPAAATTSPSPAAAAPSVTAAPTPPPQPAPTTAPRRKFRTDF